MTILLISGIIATVIAFLYYSKEKQKLIDLYKCETDRMIQSLENVKQSEEHYKVIMPMNAEMIERFMSDGKG